MSKVDPGLHYPLDLDSLPSSWEAVYVGDAATEVRSGFASGKHNQDGTGIPHLRPMNVSRGGEIDLETIKYVAPDKDSRRLAKGDVLFNNTNSAELVGKTALIKRDEDWAFSNHMTRVRFEESIDPAYAAHQLHFLWMQGYFLHKCVKHVNQASVSAKALSTTIPLVVAPLPEQRRIVARIEELFSRLDAGVAALRHAKAQLQRYRQSVLAAAVTGQLTQAWREQHPETEPAEKLLERILEQRRQQWDGKGSYREPKGFSDENPFDTPPGWALTTFEQVSRRVTVGHVGSMKDEYTESGVPFLRGQNVRANRFDPKGLRFVSAEFHKSLAKSTLQGGDIAVTRSGDVGIACVIPDELGEANCSDLVLVLGPILIDPNYAAYYMNSLGRRLVQKGKVGVAITHFNTKSVAAMPLPLPPLAEQHQIVAEIESRTTAIDHLEAELDRQITRSNRLRQSTMASAFSGKLSPPKQCG